MHSKRTSVFPFALIFLFFFYNTRPTLYVFAKGHKNAVPLANSMYILRHRYDWNKEWVGH